MSYTKKDGTIGYKKCGSIDEANTFRAEQDAKADESEASADDGHAAAVADGGGT